MGSNVVLSAGSSLLAVVSFVVGVVAVATPYWAEFEAFNGDESGHFGAWTVCRQRRTTEYRCGTRVSKLQPSEFTTAAGVCGVVAVLVAVLLCVTSPMVLAMRVTRRQVVFKFRTALLVKLVISALGATSCMLALILFSIDIDARRLGEETGYYIHKAWSFYLLGAFFALFVALCVFSAGEFVLGRRLGGDPVKFARDPSGSLAPVIANRAARHKRPVSPQAAGRTVTVTAPVSGQQQPAVTTTVTSSGGTVPYDPRRSPLRSSLKKKRAEARESSDDSIDSGVVIIGNPAPATPPAGRSKKVRIQTLDTAV
ncbi:uncharacterized protein LOC122372851 [Amphibalanus amphitrite]|uniref:uncharacterized protein LOC122372851 n=1 Tax=Amphibalanus amphitrite TaxID=1232801 RepID=UPI001C90F829|nr:uncharacterized protein LOC122372851 [Amphibalanus amphitrite]